MDSGNSGSLHSSSGAEEECDSRATSLITTQQPPPFNHHNNNQINNINSLFFSSSKHHQLHNLDPITQSKTLPATSFSNHHFFPSSSQSPVITATTSNHKNPKKRSRASRRAPTTVLTTDTNNFRAMVQEFTGIPSPPFTSPSPAFSNLTTSLDLFGRYSVSMMKTNTNNFDNLTQPPSYFPPQPSYSTFVDSCNLHNTMQNPISRLSSYPVNKSPLLNPKTTDNYFSSSNEFDAIGQIQMHEAHINLPDMIISTAATPTTRSSRNDEQVVIENWETRGGDNYTIGKEIGYDK